MDVNKIADFILKYSPYKNKELIKQYILLHLQYKTCFVVYDDDHKICAVSRWNISEDNKTACILDLMIREDYRNKEMIQRMLLQGLQMYPWIKFLKFERETKYPEREPKVYSVDKILKRR